MGKGVWAFAAGQLSSTDVLLEIQLFLCGITC